MKPSVDFRTTTVRHLGGQNEECDEEGPDCIKDITKSCLQYFFHLVNAEIGHRLEWKLEQSDRTLRRKAEVGFAAPAFWTEFMLDNFFRIIGEPDGLHTARSDQSQNMLFLHT